VHGAWLCALTKEDGGIRPIAVRCTLRRLVAKSVAKVDQEKMGGKMAPVQLGFGAKRGTEASAHAVRRFLQNISQVKLYSNWISKMHSTPSL
jgi:hypothetical protein